MQRLEAADNLDLILAVGEELADLCIVIHFTERLAFFLWLRIAGDTTTYETDGALGLGKDVVRGSCYGSFAIFLVTLFVCAQKFDTLHHKDLLDLLKVEHVQILDGGISLSRIQLELHGGLGNFLHPLLFEYSDATVPHLQSKLLHQVLQVLKQHVFLDLKIHKSVNVILALYHEELDMAPHVDGL